MKGELGDLEAMNLRKENWSSEKIVRSEPNGIEGSNRGFIGDVHCSIWGENQLSLVLARWCSFLFFYGREARRPFIAQTLRQFNNHLTSSLNLENNQTKCHPISEVSLVLREAKVLLLAKSNQHIKKQL